MQNAAVNPPSAWSLTGSGYDESNFYTGATDGKGHGETLYLKVPPAVKAEIDALVQGRQVPAYRTYNDFARDAIIHRLRWIQDNLSIQTLGPALVMEQEQAELDKLRVQRAAWKKYIEDLDASLSDLLANGELDEAGWIIERAEQIGDDSMTDQYLEMLEQVLAKHRGTIERGGK